MTDTESTSGTEFTTEADWFVEASRGFRALLPGLTEDVLHRPALGQWDVRALLGHTCRAFLTVENYLTQERGSPVTLATPTDYFRAAPAGGLADSAEVAQRGRAAGQALGDRPAAAAEELADRVTRLVTSSPPDAVVTTPFGSMTLASYLPTRAFELTVHGIDLARATGQDVPESLQRCAGPAIALALTLSSGAELVEILLALTGRQPLPDTFSLL